MKLKYFLRGLGAGIIFGALIMLAAYMSTGAYKVSDEEIIERAKELGMVEKDVILKDDTSKEDNKSTDDIIPESEDTSAENVSENNGESDTKINTENNTENVASTDSETGVISITVRPGMGSHEVATILKDAGIIADSVDFDTYLNANGYSTRIEVGDYNLSPGMSYEELANILTQITQGE